MAKKKYDILANSIIELVGGKENIKSVTHCITRLRFTLKDESIATDDEIKKLDQVIDIVKSGGQYQVVVGSIVNDVYKEVVAITGLGDNPMIMEEEENEKFSWKSLPKKGLDYLISCFVPAIPAISGAGMIKVLVVLLTTLNVLSSDSTTYTILNTIGDGIFYFLPFVVAINAANKLKVNPMIALALAAVTMHSDFTALSSLETPVTFFGITVSVVDYASQALPMVFGVLLLKYVDKFATKISPKIISVFLISMIDLLIVAPIVILIIGPVSIWLSNVLFAFCNATASLGWLAVGLNAILFPLMVLTGTHMATMPLIVQLFAVQGYDSIFLVSGLAANIAQAGAACAVAVKTQNTKLKSTGYSATASALVGITEPALYGVNLRMKKPFISMLIGAFIGGCFCGLFGLQVSTFVSPSLLTCAIFSPEGKSILFAFLGALISFVATFVVTYLVGFEDLPEEE